MYRLGRVPCGYEVEGYGITPIPSLTYDTNRASICVVSLGHIFLSHNNNTGALLRGYDHPSLREGTVASAYA